MRSSSTIRAVIIGSLIASVGIIAMQIYWWQHAWLRAGEAGFSNHAGDATYYSWLVSSVFLICIIGYLCYLLCTLFRQRRLREVQRDFINNMTHEFKTPLSSIQLCAEVLRQPGIIGNPQRLLSYATIIANETNQLTAQIERILQLVKAEKKGVQLNRQLFLWQDLLREELESFELLAGLKEGKVLLQVPEEPLVFKGDPHHLKAALNHLVDNAVKYCNCAPQIIITLREGAKSIDLMVADNGTGIDKTHQRLLFHKFYRVPSGNIHDVKGLGLGLNYVRLIARAHGGDIAVSSQLGKGSTFTLSFPRTAA